MSISTAIADTNSGGDGSSFKEDIFKSGATVQPVGIVAFTEGPLWHPSGNVYFTEIVNNKIMRLDPNGVFHTWRTPSGRANGLAFDLKGRLIACEGGGEGGNRRVTRTEHDGTVTVLTDRYQGKVYNSPNDLVVDSKGRIFFTDPRYGNRTDLQQVDKRNRTIEGVYRIDPDGSVTRIITHEVDRPNGIAVSPDGRHLYVIDNNNSIPTGNRKLWQFDFKSDGSINLETQKMLHDFGRGRGGDGMAVDSRGRLFVAAGFNVPAPPLETGANQAGIYVFSPKGKKVGFIPVLEDMVTNCCFGDRDLKTLYITAGHKLWKVPVTTAGFVVWPKKK